MMAKIKELARHLSHDATQTGGGAGHPERHGHAIPHVRIEALRQQPQHLGTAFGVPSP